MTIFRSRLVFRSTAPSAFKVVFWLCLAAAIIGFAEAGWAEVTASASQFPTADKTAPIAFHGDNTVFVTAQTAWHYNSGLRFFFFGWFGAFCTLAFAGMSGHLELRKAS